MGDNIPDESFLRRNFLGWNALGGTLMGGNFLGGSFSGEIFKCILKFVNTYVLLMKFRSKTETLMLQINANLTVSVEQLIINNKIGLAKKY